jgi:ribosome-binding factor A
MDALPDTARAIEDLLDKARQSDEKVREASAGAKYAGDADPYRKPDEDDETDDTAE